jgi:hypothetical protein
MELILSEFYGRFIYKTFDSKDIQSLNKENKDSAFYSLWYNNIEKTKDDINTLFTYLDNNINNKDILNEINKEVIKSKITYFYDKAKDVALYNYNYKRNKDFTLSSEYVFMKEIQNFYYEYRNLRKDQEIKLCLDNILKNIIGEYYYNFPNKEIFTNNDNEIYFVTYIMNNIHYLLYEPLKYLPQETELNNNNNDNNDNNDNEGNINNKKLINRLYNELEYLRTFVYNKELWKGTDSRSIFEYKNQACDEYYYILIDKLPSIYSNNIRKYIHDNIYKYIIKNNFWGD